VPHIIGKNVDYEQELKSKCLELWKSYVPQYPRTSRYDTVNKKCDELRNISKVQLIEMKLNRV